MSHRVEDPPLWDRFTRTEGRVHLTGLQALIRVALDQVRRDRADGRRVAALYSGYPGSPLAALDQTLKSVDPLLAREGVHFVPGLNEELAASTVGGTQLVERFPHADWDGVVGLWFGKAPGLDRALDAIRHCNFTGTSRYGGAVAIVGDDPFCKSSSLPSHSEHALAHAFVPVLYPADAREILELGRHAIALSRYSGLWVALKVVADVADGGAIFDLPEDSALELPKFEVRGRSFESRLDTRLLPPHVNRIEAEILYERLQAAERYAYANRLNPIAVRHERDRIGLVSSGRLYRELETALDLLGLGPAQLERLGVRLLRMRMLYPCDSRRLAEFADGLDEIIVVDERRGFLEEQVRAKLFNQVDRPLVFGQLDERDQPWLARHDEVGAETLALDLAAHFERRFGADAPKARLERLRAAVERSRRSSETTRTPVFCSGCPHSRSTRLPEGSVAGGGIGCHTMALLMDRGVQYIGAMGSEGAHWIGLEPFVDTPHIFQNLGDGTYCHSGRLAVRACVEGGATLTFKLLYNGYIAMTGGQDAVGMKSAADIARDLLADGVRKLIAVSQDAGLRALARADARVECVGRDAHDDAMRRLAREPGVTVLLFDQVCANQKQRLERRGVLAAPTERVVINEDVCEGCGDCGVASSCVSLRPVETPLGRKTRIHDGSCSDDRSCLAGDCPAFTAVPRGDALPDLERWLPGALPEPPRRELDDGRFEVFFVGVGSTGVVTVDAILVRAAEKEGLYALHLDQTGLAQRGGKVVSHCVLARSPLAGAPRVSWGRADVLFALDPLSAVNASSLRCVDPERTDAVVHEVYDPTGGMLAHPEQELPRLETLVAELKPHVRSLSGLPAEALAEATLGTSLGANVIVLGAALQRGLLPVSAGALEAAIRDRGIAVEPNLAALRLGRAVVVDPELAARILEDTRPPAVGDGGSPERAARLLGASWSALDSALSAWSPARAAPVRGRIAAFAVDLVDYQSARYARRYLATLERVAAAEARCNARKPELTATAARELYRLMAYKDEYEVARLMLRGPFRRWQDRRGVPADGRRYFLHPPLLRALGLRRKLALGRRFEPLLRALLPLRRLRGTPLDPFGHTRVRRAERELARGYTEALEAVADRLAPGLHDAAVEIANATYLVRGYEDVKLRRIPAVRERVAEKLAELDGGSTRPAGVSGDEPSAAPGREGSRPGR